MSNEPELETAEGIALKTDRRRPGRIADVSPELIPLLRGQAAPVPDQPLQFDEPDQLRGARGLAVGLAVSAGVWAAMAYLAYSVL